MDKNKQLAVNILANGIAFIVSAGTNFFLTPFIINSVGIEAYGFVQISNNLVTYFSILTIALNSMSSRFISVAYFKHDFKAANEYYSSTFYANLFLCGIFLPLLLLGVINISRILNISNNLVTDVKLLLFFMSGNFLLGLLCTNLGVSFYVKNRLYLSSFINIAGCVLKAGMLTGFYSLLPTHVAYVGFVTLAVTCFVQGSSLYYKNKLIPELKIRKAYCRYEKLREMVLAGIWNSVTRIGGILQDGLDLLITNLMMSADEMGILAAVKLIPNLVNTFIVTLANSFMPNFTELYAYERKIELSEGIKQSMRVIGVILSIPISLIIGFGESFFKLWLPQQDAVLLHQLSIISILPWIVVGQATIIHNVFTVVNRLKTNSLMVCITGLLNVMTVGFCLSRSIGGLYAVVGISTVFSVIRNLIYTIPFGARYIGCPWYTFFPEVLREVFSTAILIGINCFFSSVMPECKWIMLILYGGMAGISGLAINVFIVLNKKDRKAFMDKILKIQEKMYEKD